MDKEPPEYGRIVLMQKTYTPGFLPGKQEKNDGTLSMFFVENAHEAIVDKDTFKRCNREKSIQKITPSYIKI